MSEFSSERPCRILSLDGGGAKGFYSLGVLLYYLVSGKFPVSASGMNDFQTRHASGARTLLRDVRPDLPIDFVRIVDACTAANPDERPESAGAVEALLDRALGLRHESSAELRVAPARGRTRRFRAAAAAALLVAVVGLSAWAVGGRLSRGIQTPTRRD